MRFSLILAALVIGAGVFAGSALVAQTPDPAERVTFHTPEPGVKITDLVDWVGQNLDRPLTWTMQARQVAAGPARTVLFNRPVVMARSDVLKFAMKVLRTHKLGMVLVGDDATAYYLVESLDQPVIMQSWRRYVDEAELERLKDTYTLVACTIRVRHINVQQIQTQIQRLNPQATPFGAAIIPAPSENAFIVVDFAPNAYTVMRLIREMDVPPEHRAVRPPATAAPIARRPQLEARVAALERELAALKKALKR